MKRLFEKLGCPVLHLLDTIDSPASQAALIGWLEDRKIREYEIEQRQILKIVSPEWPNAVTAYLQVLNCPISQWLPQETSLPLNNRRALQWLASYSLSLDFSDHVDAEDSNGAIEEETDYDDKMDEDVPVNVSTDLQALYKLGEPFGLKPVSDESIADFLERLHSQLRITLADIERINTSASLPPLPLGFTTKDNIVDTIALIMKTLHVRDLRTLQSELNDLTVIAQAHTARPRMNAAQGKVGR